MVQPKLECPTLSWLANPGRPSQHSGPMDQVATCCSCAVRGTPVVVLTYIYLGEVNLCLFRTFFEVTKAYSRIKRATENLFFHTADLWSLCSGPFANLSTGSHPITMEGKTERDRAVSGASCVIVRDGDPVLIGWCLFRDPLGLLVGHWAGNRARSVAFTEGTVPMHCETHTPATCRAC